MLDPFLLIVCLLGILIGTLGGVLPGLGPTGTMVLVLPFVFTMEPLPALIILVGIMFGCNYGNSTAAILLNIPGDPAAVATAIDGHKMASGGRPGPALAIAALSSTFGQLLAIAGVAVLSVALAPIAISFGPTELFALGLLGLTLVASLSTGSAIKAYLSGGLGLVLVLPGLDPMSGLPRFTFGIAELTSGFGLVPVAMGIFAFGEIFYSIENKLTKPKIGRLGKLMPSRDDFRHSLPATIRGSLLGFFIGILPGAGPTPASFAAYGLEARVGKRRKLLGTGIAEGVAAPESANNAAAGGALVPMLTLAIPGSAPTAVILGALIVLGVHPGPLFLSEQRDLFWGIIAACVIATALLLIVNLPLVGVWATVLRTPFPLLMTILLTITVAGIYSVQNSIFDIWVALGFGVLGYFLRRAEVPLAPLILGFVLAEIIENSLRQGLLIGHGSFESFLTRPVSATLLALCLLIVVAPPAIKAWRKSREKRRNAREPGLVDASHQ